MEKDTIINIALYKALLDAGIKEEHALTAAREVANNGMTVGEALAKLDSDIRQLRFDMEKAIAKSTAELTDKLTWRIIIAMIGVLGISLTFSYLS